LFAVMMSRESDTKI